MIKIHLVPPGTPAWQTWCVQAEAEHRRLLKAHVRGGAITFKDSLHKRCRTVSAAVREHRGRGAQREIATFLQVFPNGTVWRNDNGNAGGYDVVLAGRIEETVAKRRAHLALRVRPEVVRVPAVRAAERRRTIRSSFEWIPESSACTAPLLLSSLASSRLVFSQPCRFGCSPLRR